MVIVIVIPRHKLITNYSKNIYKLNIIQYMSSFRINIMTLWFATFSLCWLYVLFKTFICL